MRFAFFDETGIGNRKEDDHVIVAGLIVHVDEQMPKIEKYLSELWNKTIPLKYRDSFVFHATEFFGRRGPVFDRDTGVVSDADRKLIQESLAAIPVKFDLPFILEAADRKKVSGEEVATDLLASHVTAMFLCSLDVEYWMRAHGHNDEICQFVVEQNDHAQRKIKEIHQAFCRQDLWSELQEDAGDISIFAHLLPFQRIRKAVLFEGKSSPSILEVVDFCAYVVRKIHRKENLNIFEPLLQAFWGRRVFAVK